MVESRDFFIPLLREKRLQICSQFFYNRAKSPAYQVVYIDSLFICLLTASHVLQTDRRTDRHTDQTEGQTGLPSQQWIVYYVTLAKNQ